MKKYDLDSDLITKETSADIVPGLGARRPTVPKRHPGSTAISVAILATLVVCMGAGLAVLALKNSTANSTIQEQIQTIADIQVAHAAEIAEINDENAQSLQDALADAQARHEQDLADAKAEYEQQFENILHHMNDVNHIEVSPEVHVTMESLKSIISPTSELVSGKYYYSSADVYDKAEPLFNTPASVPLSTSKYIFKMNGMIGAGVDLRDVRFVINESAKTITIIFPKPRIFSHTVVTEPVDPVVTATFYKITEEERDNFQKMMLAKEVEKLLNNSAFWQTVRESAEKTVKNMLLTSSDTNDYTITAQWPDVTPDKIVDSALITGVAMDT